MKPQNLLIVMSDQHSRKALGCYGHPLVKTPHLDRLAAGGTLFKNAYTNSPICVPARASFATGRYVHDIGYWDNARPYEGSVPSWGHRLSHHGHSVESIGKLHYRSEQDPTGFDRQHLPMHVVGGAGDLLGSLRDGTALLSKYRAYHLDAGPGTSTYTDYDRNITSAACDWLKSQSTETADKPWVVFVSLVCPHPPLQCPPEFYEMYPPQEMPWPVLYDPDERPMHPAAEDHRKFHGCADAFSEDVVRRSMSAYFGLCTYLDANVGKLMTALEQTGLSDTTRIIYTSDHGEHNGNQGIWGKCTMFEDSAGVPVIMSGDGIPQGRVIDTPVSHVDFYPTIMAGTGVPSSEDDHCFPGKSLFDLANGADQERFVFSEFHAAASNRGQFMIRKGPLKYVYYVGYPDQLFNLDNDPDERLNLAGDPDHQHDLEEMEALLRSVVDPDYIDAMAKSDQAARLAANGGRDAIRTKGSFGYTPAPGEAAVFK